MDSVLSTSRRWLTSCHVTPSLPQRLDVFNGVQQWMEANECSPGDAKDLLIVVRLSLIPMDSPPV